MQDFDSLVFMMGGRSWLAIAIIALAALLLFSLILRWVLGLNRLIYTQEQIAIELIRVRVAIERLEQQAGGSAPQNPPQVPPASPPPPRRHPLQP